jgi:Zn finger protein HypA/HybF involved in hydrogenase expression
MQEDTLVKNLLSALQTAGNTLDAQRVTRVRVKLASGPQELHTEQVEEIFARLSQGTIAEGALLEIDEVLSEEAEVLLIEEADLVGPVTEELGGGAVQPPG